MINTWSYFDDWINNALGTLDREFSPKWRRDDERGGWKLSFILPGVKKEDVDVTAGPGWSRVKHPNGSLRISLPKDIDHEGISAKLDLGIFELFVPDVKATGERKVKVQ
jgi:HSP20 family molecular chaperone IbpA